MFAHDLEWVWKKFRRGDFRNDKFPTDGTYIQFYKEDTTRVARIFTIADSVLNGRYRSYRFNGKLEEDGNMDAGESTGHWTYYFPNGQMKREGRYRVETLGKAYRMSEPIGTWRHWHENGKLRLIQEYTDDSRRTGLWIYYHDNGQIQSQLHYVDNQLNGKSEKYAPNGQLLASETYQNGIIIDSVSTHYYANGKVHKQGQLSKNIPVGPWTYNFVNGNVRCLGDFSSYETTLCRGSIPKDCLLSTLSGAWKLYHSNGQLKAKGRFKPVWEATSRGNIKTPMEAGYWEYFYEDGQLMASGYYHESPENIPLVKRGRKAPQAKRLRGWTYLNTNGVELKKKRDIREINDYILQVNNEFFTILNQ